MSSLYTTSTVHDKDKHGCKVHFKLQKVASV
jgi:hypothetical protein